MNPNQASAVQNQGVFERINDTLRNSRLGQMATAALATLTLGAGVEAANLAFNASPVAAENVPARTAFSGLSQACKKLLRPPAPVSAEMFHAGTMQQQVLIKGSYPGVVGCDTKERLGKYRVQVKQNGHWINPESALFVPLDAGVKDHNAAHDGVQLDGGSPVPDRCVGKRRMPERIQFQNYLATLAGKIIAKGKIKNKRVSYDPKTTKPCN